MDNRLVHLNDKQIEELIERYYNKENIKSLLEEFNIDIKPNQLVKTFPPKITDEVCPYCNVHLTIQYTARDYKQYKNTLSCPSCGHEKNGFCHCKNCQEGEKIRVQNDKQKKQESLESLLQIDENEKVDYNTLSFEEKVYLGTFLREGISEDFNYIKPIQNFVNQLAPTNDLTNEIISLLRERRIIVIHPNSDSDFFEDINFETGSFRFYQSKVKWALNVKKDGVNKVPLVESIINPNHIISSEESYLLWKKIALHETLEYFYHSINNILGVEYSPGEKTISIFNDLLNEFSVSQIYTIIYRSTNNALRFQVEKDVSRKHAANTIIGNAQSFAERATIKKWDIQRYNRLKECPESALSKFFFERVLKIGSAGFNEKPRIINQSYYKKNDE